MTTALITGGAGRLGRSLRPQLAAQGIRTIAMTRRPNPRLTADEQRVADLATGAGLSDALAGVDLLVHAASDPRRAARVDVEGTRALLAAAREAGVGQVVYVSVCGVDRIPMRYYRAKLAAESLVARSGLPHTIVRGTQFFDFVAELAKRAATGPVALAPFRWASAPCDVGEFAGFVARKTLDAPTNGVVDFAGPERLDLAAMIRQWWRSQGDGRPVVQLPVPGATGYAFRRGFAVPDAPAARGRAVWRDWREASAPARPELAVR